MAHYLTKEEIYQYFSNHITKKELKIQKIGTTITLKGEQIVIISDSKFSKLNSKNK